MLKKLKNLAEKRIDNANYIAKKIGTLPGIIPPALRKGCSNVFYVQSFKYNEEIVGISRNKFIEAVKAELTPTEGRETEGVRISVGYVKPLYLQPMYQKLIGYGKKGCPFKCPMHKGSVSYKKGICPTIERLHEKELFSNDLMHSSMKRSDLDDVVMAFEKVYALRKTI